MIEPHVMHEFGVIGLMLGCGLMSVALFRWLYERDSELRRKILGFVHRPAIEMLIIATCVGAVVQTGATKGPLGAPRRPIAPPISTELDSVGESSSAGTDIFPAYTNTVTNVIATGVMPLSDCVVVRAHRPIWSDPMTADFEVYAKTNLLSDVWSGVGKAKMSVDSCGTLISLPYSDLPGGMTDTMFFVIGLTVDTDDDGLSDSFESLVSGTDPASSDTDGDGMPDGWEYAYGIDPNSAIGCDGADYDVDGDGLVNIDEYRYGSDPCKTDSDFDGLDDRMEVGAVEELRGDDFLWLDTSSLTTRFGDYVFYDSFSCEMALSRGVLINGVCYTNAIVNLDGFVTLKDPVDQSAYVGTGYDYYGGLSNYLWSAKHVTIAAYNSNLYAKPRIQDWHSELRCGTVSSGARRYAVTEYRNVSHKSLRNTSAALMNIQVIVPEDETNVVYVSYLSVAPAVVAADDMAAIGVQLPGTNCVPGRGVYANVTWNRSPGCFNEPLTLKYHLGTGTLPYASDCDGDGLDDFVERFVRHTDPYLADTDGDGLTDNIEVRTGTDPLRSDTDDDGMSDGWEVEHGLDPLSDDSEEDADFDGLVNVQEYKNGTDPRCRDTDGDFLDDVIEAWWIEDGVTNVPWFSVQPMVSFSPSQTVYTALISCEIPFVNRIGATSAEVAVADVNGIVHFGRQNATNQIRSMSSCRDLSMPVNYECSVVAAYWTSLAMRPALGSTVTMGTAIADGKRYFVVEYDRIGLYYGSNDQNVSFQVSIPEDDPDLVFVRYGEIDDRRTSGAQTIGMQGARVGGFSNWPCVNYRYPSPLPIVEPGSALAFHFGSGGDPLVADTDQDGLDDRVESIIGTNPKLQDTDGDGYGDGLEVEYGMSPLCGSGVYGADGDFDGDGLANSEEPKFGTALNIADCDADGLKDGDETGYIVVSNCLPWLAFDRFEDCTEDLIYSTHYRYHVNRGLPCPLSVQGVPVTNVTFTSFGWLYFNRVGNEDEWRGDGSLSFDRIVDRDVLAVAPFGDGSLFVKTDVEARPTSVRFGMATYDGVGYIVLEYDNLYRDLSSYRTNSISFQVAIPTNVTDCVYVRYRDVIGESMDGRRCGIGMQTFGGKWLHSYCYQRAGSVFDGLALKFAFGYNTDPLERDSDADGIDDGDEVEVGLNPAEADSDGDGMPDGWERRYGIDPLSDCDDDGAAGDVDSDGLPNGMEYEYGTNPLVADTDGDGLTDGREVAGIYEDPKIAWLTMSSSTDLTDRFSNSWECVDYPLVRPCVVYGETVTNMTLDAHGVIYLNRAGVDSDIWASSPTDLANVAEGDRVVLAPYWSSLSIADVVAPSEVKVGYASTSAGECLVIEFANMYYYPNSRQTNCVSFQVTVPTGTVSRIGVKYSGFVGDRTDGRDAVVGFRSFDGRNCLEYCRFDRDRVADGMGLVFLLGYGSDPLRVDTDADGIDDRRESEEIGTDPCRRDTDADGIADSDECGIGTSPVDSDSDGDGLADGWECKYGLDPLSAVGDDGADGDPDLDGLTNGDEQYYGSDPTAADTDGDGLDDADELIIGTEVLNGDTDGDGLPDGEELVLGTSPFLEDTDGDGLDDSWEHEYGFDPLSTEGSDAETSADDDEDGLTNLEEYECGSNPLSADSDGDGLDDYHEVRVSMTNPVRPDTDYDGIGDLEELSMGLDPRQPDTDGDGMNDGWEYRYRDYGFDPAVMNTDDDRTMMAAAGGGGRRPHTGPNDDLDGDGLTNAEECSFGTNPGVKDSDGDGVTDGDEVAQESDPADGSDNGISQSRVAVQFTFGDPSPSHSEKYRLEILPESGPADESAPDGYVLLNERYGVCETKTVMFKPGWRYAVRFYHAATDPDYHGSPNPDYDYELSWCSPSGLVLVDDPTEIFGENGNSGYSFTGEGKVAYVQAVRIRHELLWETANKANQIFNPTHKDDFTGEGEVEWEGIYSYAAHRNFLYVVEDNNRHAYCVTEKIKSLDIPQSYRDKLRCAAFMGTETIEDSTVAFSSNNEAVMEIKVKGANPDLYDIRVGMDKDDDGVLSYAESVPLEVYRHSGTSMPVVVCGTTAERCRYEDSTIGGYTAGIAQRLLLPVAQSLLSIFYRGNEGEIAGWLKSPSKNECSFDAFAECADFSEWLTHNSGADFTDDRHAQINTYTWDESSQMASFLAHRTPLAPWQQYTAKLSMSPVVSTMPYYTVTPTGSALMRFYSERVYSDAVERLTDAPDGTVVEMSSENCLWTDKELEAIVFGPRSLVVTDATTLNIGRKGLYSGKEAVAFAFGSSALTGGSQLNDLDAFFAVGRGRLKDPRYRFFVQKNEHWFRPTTYDLIRIGFSCQVSDLYDFNYEDGDLSREAAILQIGYGKGANGRCHGKIYSHEVKIRTEYYNPFVQ